MKVKLQRKNGRISTSVVAKLMGQQVAVQVVYDRRAQGADGVKRWIWSTREVPRVGWVVGLSWLQTGRSQDGTTWVGDDEPPEYYTYLHETARRMPVLLVCYWPGLAPVRVPLDGWRMPVEGERPVSSQRLAWEQQSEVMKEQIREWGRDLAADQGKV